MSKGSTDAGTRLAPTLWRTCRVLANRRRLCVFRLLLERGGMTVSEVAECAGISSTSATQCLRALNARGLLDAKRVSRWVRYRVGHDPTVHGTREIVQALRRQLRSSGDVIERTFGDVTAFTHPRRVIIVRELSGSSGLSSARLMAITGISAPALSRHLEKLQHRGVVGIRKQGYICLRPRTPVLKTLVRLASA